MILRRWDMWTVFITVLSLISWFATAVMIDAVDFSVWEFYQTGIFPHILADVNFWLVSLLAIAVTIMPYFGFKAFKRQFFPEVCNALTLPFPSPSFFY